LASEQLSGKKLFGAFAICGAVWAALQAYLLHSFGFVWMVSLADAGISTILLSVACWLINNNLRYYQPDRGSYIYLMVWCGALAAGCAAACRYIIPFFGFGVVYDNFLKQSFIIRLFTDFLAIGWMAMISALFYSQIDHKKTEQRKTEAEKLARDAELYNLRQQLQPHFLFNSLNSINALIGFKPDEARRMIHQLSDFLRGTLKKDDQLLVPLSDELTHLNLYLEIEKVRFGHRLQTEISCDNACGEALLPSLLLQPLVENAIKFGLYDTTGDVTVSIRAEIEEQLPCYDDPKPLRFAKPPARAKAQVLGLSGVQRRLYLIFARNDLMETHANDNIFTTIIKIPQL
jgi:two-component system LytT family sensor kinase